MSEFSGALYLKPGQPLTRTLRSTRQAWAQRLAPGHSATALPGLLAGVFSLCAQAHRAASQLALAAAQPSRFAVEPGLAQSLQRETALEHLRRMVLDWPRELAPPAQREAFAEQALRSLLSCPLTTTTPGQGAATWGAMRQWLHTQWLHMPAQDWWQAWQQGGADWLQQWSRSQPGWLPQTLQAARAWDCALPQLGAKVLRVHAQPSSLQALGQALAQDPGLALYPLWQGQTACTGPWARLGALTPPPLSAWGLLGSRLAELVALCLPDWPGQNGAGVLRWGAVQTAPQCGLGWVEMARGLLIHQVRLEPESASRGRDPYVLECQVLAPTEWNFHPAGVAAQALAEMPASGPELRPRVALLMAALDPCVPYHLLEAQGARSSSKERFDA
ncbi:hypothetical protein ACG0Z6_09940 [Roseateles sp. BYS180W]|uniref:Hydrogenase formation protein n=1 Tax=Roseateles rivi TaxID=3299028 RepID=A0ABW7FW60_9BURK